VSQILDIGAVAKSPDPRAMLLALEIASQSDFLGP